MIARGIDREGLEAAALESGVRLVNLRPQGRGFAFTLGLQGELWRRRGHSGRKIAAVCYHGHAAFMRELFARAPEAVLVSAQARYDGVRDFQAKACGVGEREIGSAFQPMQYSEACDCAGELAGANL